MFDQNTSVVIKATKYEIYGGPQVSRHKQEPHGTNKNVTAQTRTSRHKQEPHGTNKSFTAQTRTSRHKQEPHGTNKHKLKVHGTRIMTRIVKG